ncbi:hypothetical protein SAY86_024136 [Trapa natans]|uniref:Pectinesterase inhibitor domain-containing protein n=1 Tax=Trapa natans TaxID=22666 RepID=A0AAN7MBK6_TRANT|nr:hypothetical protein SAY86_024136 [Trapa natans]
MRPTAALFTFLPFALCLLHFGLADAQAVAPSPAVGAGLLAKVCGLCKNRNLCLSSLGADPNAQGADLSGLTLISIRVATANATNTSAYIRRMLNDTSLEPAVQQALNDCADSYNDAVQQLDDSLAALTVRNYADLRKWVKTAVKEVDSCGGAFMELGSADKLGVANRSRTVKHLCNNALTVMGVLQKNRQ